MSYRWLEPLGHDAQSQGLNLGLCLGTVRSIGQDAWQISHFRDPPTVFFLLELNLEPQVVSVRLILALLRSKVRRTAALSCEAPLLGVPRQLNALFDRPALNRTCAPWSVVAPPQPLNEGRCSLTQT